jgi:glycosyltransferase involved in cell wall biosynthesis
MPQFSIIIPTYNRSRELTECLTALDNQLGGNEFLEVIVVNDGGKKEPFASLSFSRGLDVKYFHLERCGPAAARNFAVEKAQADIILCLDDDSVPADSWLTATKKAWNNHPDADGVGGYIISEVGDSMYCKINADLFNWYCEQSSSQGQFRFLATCNAGYKKSILKEIGGFDEQFKNAAGEDRDLNIKITKAGGKLVTMKDITVYHEKNLPLNGFVGKHFNYGQAAYTLYARYPDLQRLSIGAYLRLYTSILQKYNGILQKIIVFLLLTVSQVATIIGYGSAMIQQHK